MAKILILDDEADMLEVCDETLAKIPGAIITTQTRPRQALELLQKESFDLLLVDLKMPEMDGIEVLRKAKALQPEIIPLVFTGFPTIKTAVEAMKLGALDFIPKPFAPDHLQTVVQKALEKKNLQEENLFLSREMEKPYKSDTLLGNSEPIKKVLHLIETAAPTPSDILIVGETGSGKEIVARTIHRASLRRDRRFVPVDCGAIPENLLETEFFGYERGAFTGAHRSTMGLLEFAHGGTLFLDEVCELSSSLQSKLLRAIQERTFRRVGATAETEVDIRLIAATNRDIDREVQEGRFREDLFYRLNVIRIRVPPLRERPGDIPIFVKHFLSRYAREFKKNIASVEESALDALIHFPWPGNVRQLQNILKRGVLLCQGSSLSLHDLPEGILKTKEETSPGGFFKEKKERLIRFEMDYIQKCLAKSGGDVAKAAREAKIPRGTFYRLMKKYHLRAGGYKSG